MDGFLVIISLIDIAISSISASSSPRIFGILRVFRLLRTLRPLRVISRAPGLKLVVQTLLSSLRPIGNIVLICCTFFIIFGILGVQLFKGQFYYCQGLNVTDVITKTNCFDKGPEYRWINRKYNFDDLGQALMSLFVLASKDGWVLLMYTGLDAVGEDMQPKRNHNEWRLIYFISFLLLVGFFVLNMFVGVVVENFHKCRENQEKEEKARRAAKRAKKMERKRRRMRDPPYWANYTRVRLFIHSVISSQYFDLAIAGVIGFNVVTMALEYYMMPAELEFALKIFNYFFTSVFILEAGVKLVALGIAVYLKDKWNQLDITIVMLSLAGIILEEMKTGVIPIPINPTIIRVMRVLRIARVLKLLKMAKGIRALLDTVVQALPQVGNLGLLFFLLFFIFAALGVEMFGRLDCSQRHPCEGLSKHAHFQNFGMAFLTLFRVATGDNWNGIMKDTLRDDCDTSDNCEKNCCVSHIIAPVFFVIFVLMAQFVLVNVVVAVLMKHLQESHKMMDEDAEMEAEIERELEEEARNNNNEQKDKEILEVKSEEDSYKEAVAKLHQGAPTAAVSRMASEESTTSTLLPPRALQHHSRCSLPEMKCTCPTGPRRWRQKRTQSTKLPARRRPSVLPGRGLRRRGSVPNVTDSTTLLADSCRPGSMLLLRQRSLHAAGALPGALRPPPSPLDDVFLPAWLDSECDAEVRRITTAVPGSAPPTPQPTLKSPQTQRRLATTAAAGRMPARRRHTFNNGAARRGSVSFEDSSFLCPNDSPDLETHCNPLAVGDGTADAPRARSTPRRLACQEVSLDVAGLPDWLGTELRGADRPAPRTDKS